MDKDLKIILKEKMKERGFSTPKLGRELDIPPDRIYAWYRDNTSPKAADKEKIEKWINGGFYNSAEGRTATAPFVEEETEGKYLQKYIESLEKHNAFLEKMMESSLGLIADRQLTIQAEVQAVHQWDAQSKADGDKENEAVYLNHIQQLSAGNLERLRKKSKPV